MILFWIGIFMMVGGVAMLVWALADNHRWLHQEEYRHRRRHRRWDGHDDDPRPDSYKTR